MGVVDARASCISQISGVMNSEMEVLVIVVNGGDTLHLMLIVLRPDAHGHAESSEAEEEAEEEEEAEAEAEAEEEAEDEAEADAAHGLALSHAVAEAEQAGNAVRLQKIVDMLGEAAVAWAMGNEDAVAGLVGRPFTVYEIYPPFSSVPADVILGFATSCERDAVLSIRLVEWEGGSRSPPRFPSFRCSFSRSSGLVPALLGTTLLPAVAMPDGCGLKVSVSGDRPGIRAICAHLHDSVVLGMALAA